MVKTSKNFDEIIRKYQEEVRIWTRSWLETNLHKPLPEWDSNGNMVSQRNDHFDLWAPRETLQDFAEEIALDHIVPLIEEDLKKKNVKEDWEKLLIPSEDSAQEYIFPVLMKTFRDEAIALLDKFNTVLHEIDRDLLGLPKADFSANRIFAAITLEIEGNIIAQGSPIPVKTKSARKSKSAGKLKVSTKASTKKASAQKFPDQKSASKASGSKKTKSSVKKKK